MDIQIRSAEPRAGPGNVFSVRSCGARLYGGPPGKAVRASGLVLTSLDEPLAAGFICLGKLAAVAGAVRVIGDDPVLEPAARLELESNAERLLERMKAAYRADPRRIPDEEPAERFRRVCGKSHSVVEVERHLAVFEEFSCVVAAEHRNTPGVFSKDESTAKEVAARVMARPRAIATMGSYTNVLLCPISDILSKFWSLHLFAGAHIKDKTESEVQWQIYTAQSTDRQVTDMSGFEGSCGPVVRELENSFISWALRYELMIKAAEHFEEITEDVTVKLRELLVWLHHRRRKSGEYQTSFGNWDVNVLLLITSLTLRGKTFDEAFNMVFAPGSPPGTGAILEGDDGSVRRRWVAVDVYRRLGFKFSANVCGEDADFLRSWFPEPPNVCGPVVNVLRTLRSFAWLRGAGLKPSKLAFLLRSVAWSAHVRSPGHPVIFAFVNLVGRITAGASKFSGAEKYYGRRQIDPAPGVWPTIEVCERLRKYVADGRGDALPSISVQEQLRLEASADSYDGSIDVGDVRDIPEGKEMLESSYLRFRFDEPGVDFGGAPQGRWRELLIALSTPSDHPLVSNRRRPDHGL